MSSPSTEQGRFAAMGIWVQDCLFLVVSFWFLFTRVHPLLILESQPPAFLIDQHFFHSFFIVPGGMIDWCAALVMQFWFSNFWVSLFFAVCFWLIAFLTRRWMDPFSEAHGVHTVHLIPACMLVLLTAQYDFHFSIILAVILNLCAVNMFIRIAPKQKIFRAGAGIIGSLLLFWISGGAFFIFTSLCCLNEILSGKKFVTGVLQFAGSLLLSSIVSTYVFFVPFAKACTHNLMGTTQIALWYVRYALPLFYLTAIIVIALLKIDFIRASIRKVENLIRWNLLAIFWKCVIGILFLMSGFMVTAQGYTNNNVRLVLEINQWIKQGQWEKAQDAAIQSAVVNPLISSQTSFALFQSGSLLNRVFSFPQFYGSDGLIMDYDWSLKFPERASNLYWRLGLVNESLRWSHEAFELKGPTPEILKQLGTAYMIKGDHDAAKKFFLNLKNVPFHEHEAEYLLRINESASELAADSIYQNIQSCIPDTNVMMIVKSPPDELELLLKRNPHNKMAFEYLIVYYLMNGNLQGFLNHFPEGRVFNYPGIPTHMQEAFLVIASFNTRVDRNQLNSIVDPKTFRRYADYQQILQKYRGDVSSAKQEIQLRFGDTYWFYLMYERSHPLLPEENHEFQ